jgi:hypothetical protein
MKKLLLVLAIGAFVACNDGGSTTDAPATDSPAVAVDSPVTTPPVDTTHLDTTGKVAAPDTTIKK